MPGFYCTVKAWHGALPRPLWPSALSALPGLDSMIVDGNNVFGTYYLQSTPAQDLRWYEMYFVPYPLPIDRSEGVVQIYMRVDILKAPVLFAKGLPCVYLGYFKDMGPLLGVDLSGPVIHRGGAPIHLHAPIGKIINEDSRRATEILFMAALQGQPEPTFGYVDSWWKSPVMAMDAIIPGDYYELYFMRDYGTQYGECVACYVTTRSRSCGRAFGLFHKVELYRVPHNDPAMWFRFEAIGYLRELPMMDWAMWGDVRAMM